MKKFERIIVYSLIGVALILGMVLDLKISSALFRPTNWFGITGEILGELPAFILIIFAALLIAFHHPRPNVIVDRVIFGVFLAAAIGVGIYCGHHTTKLLFRCFGWEMGTLYKWAIKLLIGFHGFAIAFFLTRLIDEKMDREVFGFGVMFLCFAAISLLVMQAGKMIWLRPRYRTLVALQDVGAIDDAATYWLPLWRPQFFTSFSKYQAGGAYGFTESQITEAMRILHIDSWSKEEFYSFPSGHTMNSLLLLSICLLPPLMPKLRGKKSASFIMRMVVYGLVTIIAISRIVRGAHNLSDVAAGFLFGVLIFDLGTTFLNAKVIEPKLIPLFYGELKKNPANPA